MRLQSSIFVSALMRSQSSMGSFCAVLNKGAQEAGAIYICHNKAKDNSDFYGPVPQAFLPDEHANDRYFELLNKAVDDQTIIELIEKQKKFDLDIWVVEIENSNDLSGVNIISVD